MIPGDGVLTAGGADGISFSDPGMSAEGQGDDIGIQFQGTVHHSQIDFLGLAMFKLMGQAPMSRIGFGDYQDTGGIAVQPMYDPRAKPAIYLGEGVTIVDQTIDQGSPPVSPGRMDDEIGRLVEDDQMLILENDVQGDIFGGYFIRRGRGQDQIDLVPRRELITGLGGTGVDRNGIFTDQFLDQGAGEIREAMT